MAEMLKRLQAGEPLVDQVTHELLEEEIFNNANRTGWVLIINLVGQTESQLVECEHVQIEPGTMLLPAQEAFDMREEWPRRDKDGERCEGMVSP
jgi:hypothetical protein